MARAALERDASDLVLAEALRFFPVRAGDARAREALLVGARDARPSIRALAEAALRRG